MDRECFVVEFESIFLVFRSCSAFSRRSIVESNVVFVRRADVTVIRCARETGVRRYHTVRLGGVAVIQGERTSVILQDRSLKEREMEVYRGQFVVVIRYERFPVIFRIHVILVPFTVSLFCFGAKWKVCPIDLLS